LPENASNIHIFSRESINEKISEAIKRVKQDGPEFIRNSYLNQMGISA